MAEKTHWTERELWQLLFNAQQDHRYVVFHIPTSLAVELPLELSSDVSEVDPPNVTRGEN